MLYIYMLYIYAIYIYIYIFIIFRWSLGETLTCVPAAIPVTALPTAVAFLPPHGFIPDDSKYDVGLVTNTRLQRTLEPKWPRNHALLRGLTRRV